MEKTLLKLILKQFYMPLGVVFLLAGCTAEDAKPTIQPTATLTPSATQQSSTATPSMTPTLVPTATSTPVPTATTIPTQTPRPTETYTPAPTGTPRFHPSEVRTGIDELDNIIDAVLTGNISAQRQLLSFSMIGCTKRDGLGGPPKCSPSKSEGELVKVLPILGPEGRHLEKENLDQWQGIQTLGLYSVYEISDEIFSSPDYPAGEIGILFALHNELGSILLHTIDGQIVRYDFSMGTSPVEKFEEVTGDVLLEPPIYDAK